MTIPIYPLICISVVFLFAVVYEYLSSLRTLYFKLPNIAPVDNIYNYMTLQNEITRSTNLSSFHKWNEDIQPYIKHQIEAIDRQIIQKIGNDFTYIPSMTEFYYSSKHNNNSDKQFTDVHFDGPFRYCNLYRVLICINGNKNIRTVFPDDNLNIQLKTYDAIMFDYNKTLHHIYVDSSQNDENQRILLKLHYLRSPLQSHCEKMHCLYGRATRNLFERNKTSLSIDGALARISLYYFAFKKYVLLSIFFLLVYTLYQPNVFTLSVLYVFVLLEVCIFIYIYHFQFITHPQCEFFCN